MNNEKQLTDSQKASARIADALKGKSYWEKKETAARLHKEMYATARCIVPIPYGPHFPQQVIGSLIDAPLWEIVPGLEFEKTQKTYTSREDYEYLRDIIRSGVAEHPNSIQLTRALEWVEKQLQQPFTLADVLRDKLPELRRELRQATINASPVIEFSAPPTTTTHAFDPLLLNYTLPELTALLRELGLLNDAGKATPAASSGAWVGVIYALLDPTRPRLNGKSKAAIQRAFKSEFGAGVSERAVQDGLGTRGSEAERFRDRALALLNQ